MWIVVGMASSQETAKAMKKGLEEEGILVKLRNVTSKMKTGKDTYEVLVLESEGDAAHEILIELGL